MMNFQASISYGLVAFLVIFGDYFQPGFCHNNLRPHHFSHRNHTKGGKGRKSINIKWKKGIATWYGSPTGFGSDGGACGYTTAVKEPPFSSMITAISHNLYKDGKGCGVCYEVKCKQDTCCSQKPVRVVVTDLCPTGDTNHFDLSGTAFSALAKPGQEENLRRVGVLQIEWTRVPCDYGSRMVQFKIDAGANPYYLALLVEYVEGDGDISKVYVRDCNSKPGEYMKMDRSWGALWKLNAPNGLKPPFSLLLKSRYSGSVLVADNVIPADWKPGCTYTANANFRIH